MSHQEASNLSKKAPGSLGNDGGKRKMDSSVQISDAQAQNAKQLLNAYIYDFLVKNGLSQTAKIFVNEAEVPSSTSSPLSQSKDIPHPNDENSYAAGNLQFQKDNNLPLLSMNMDVPQGFLYEWWQVFWDVFQARNNKRTNQYAMQYYQMQLMRQRQSQDFPGVNLQPSMVNVPNGQMPPQNPLQANQSSPVEGQYQHMSHQHIPQSVPSSQIPFQSLEQAQQYKRQQSQPPQNQQPQPSPHPSQPPQPQQAQQIPQQSPSSSQQSQPQSSQPQQSQPQSSQPQQSQPQQQQQQSQQQRYMMQMMMKQQQMAFGNNPIDPQQQQMMTNVNPNFNMQQQMFLNQQQTQNRIQQHAQNQMNSFRQQAAVASQQSGSSQGQDSSNNNSPAQRMNSQVTPQIQPAPQPRNSISSVPPGQQGMMHGPQVANSFNQIQPPNNIKVENKSVFMNNSDNVALQNSNNNNNSAVNAPNKRNMNALQDYQMQLMLLEQQNKKRLDIARNNGNTDPNGIISMSSGMLPPQQPQQPNQQAQKGSSSNVSSPVINNKPGNPTLNANKRKKEPPNKRGRKPSAVGNLNNGVVPGSSNNATGAGPVNGGNISYSTPLTPASEAPNETKRKRKSVASVESPNKQPSNKMSSAGKDNIIQEEPHNDKKEDANSRLNVPESTTQHNEKGFAVEILGNNHNENPSYFDSGNPNIGGLDDIDFDFNQFLDGTGEHPLNDSIGGFNWGNVDAIENADN
ncbi:Piso0_000795 [Millerozyma farinosa CBS 7064]|uniref:Piso0_000795 protein n=1 Tax=Pichia sorbitophila (strain ATCC MYA-4447 / BCRC 22081 / CBS 7064 / NBRC 10061 / NRRL Y-12695) TaxID=559304 RepID=G8YQ31_PICSO|nr:Piso0_000795 [Millerozyma farinosa CBS 7064]